MIETMIDVSGLKKSYKANHVLSVKAVFLPCSAQTAQGKQLS